MDRSRASCLIERSAGRRHNAARADPSITRSRNRAGRPRPADHTPPAAAPARRVQAVSEAPPLATRPRPAPPRSTTARSVLGDARTSTATAARSRPNRSTFPDDAPLQRARRRSHQPPSYPSKLNAIADGEPLHERTDRRDVDTRALDRQHPLDERTRSRSARRQRRAVEQYGDAARDCAADRQQQSRDHPPVPVRSTCRLDPGAVRISSSSPMFCSRAIGSGSAK